MTSNSSSGTGYGSITALSGMKGRRWKRKPDERFALPAATPGRLLWPIWKRNLKQDACRRSARRVKEASAGFVPYERAPHRRQEPYRGVDRSGHGTAVRSGPELPRRRRSRSDARRNENLPDSASLSGAALRLFSGELQRMRISGLGHDG